MKRHEGRSSRARRRAASRPVQAGARPGIESFAGIDQPPAPGTVRLQWYDYDAQGITLHESDDVDAVVRAPRREGVVRWINVDGLHPYVVNRLREVHGFHTLAAEDVLRTSQRPKLDAFDNSLFVVARMLTLQEGSLHHEQVSCFLFADTLITFQEQPGDVWDPIRQRLQPPGSRLRSLGPAYLLYALLDAVVDQAFPILEHYGDQLEELEGVVVEDPQPGIQRDIHRIKRELAVLRRVLWPMREVVNGLCRDDSDMIPDSVKTFIRDVYDHAIQVMEMVESYREQAGGLNDLYMSAVSNRMNEIMKVLTIMASVFIPITFFAGVYGMNFEYLPELKWHYSYAVFWGVCLGVVAGLLWFFRRRGWIGRR